MGFSAGTCAHFCRVLLHLPLPPVLRRRAGIQTRNRGGRATERRRIAARSNAVGGRDGAVCAKRVAALRFGQDLVNCMPPLQRTVLRTPNILCARRIAPVTCRATSYRQAFKRCLSGVHCANVPAYRRLPMPFLHLSCRLPFTCSSADVCRCLDLSLKTLVVRFTVVLPCPYSAAPLYPAPSLPAGIFIDLSLRCLAGVLSVLRAAGVDRAVSPRHGRAA